jgi:hypothetical protein
VKQRRQIVRGGLVAFALAGLMGVAGTWLTPASAAATPDPPGVSGCADIEGEIPVPGNPNKGTLCHFTGSESNPFVINEVSLNAVDSHMSHHGDCVRYFDGTLECF